MKKLLTFSFSSLFLVLAVFCFNNSVHADTIGLSTAPGCTVLTHNMSLGSRDASTGGDVTRLQAYLQSLGYLNINPTGYFGPLTKTAAIRFQSVNGITPEGNVGPITRASIASRSCSNGSSTGNSVINTITPPSNSNTNDINETNTDIHNSRSGKAISVPTEQFATASDGTPLHWDVYQPTGTGPWPAVLVIHGGGFKYDSEGPEMVQAAEDLQAHGYIAFVIQYRLAPGPDQLQGQKSAGQYPDQTNDVKLAVLAARKDSRTNGKVGAVGGSAGGSHTAYIAVTGTTGADKIDAGVSLSGAYDFADPTSLQSNDFYKDVTNYVNSSSSTPLLDASPYHFVTSSAAPLYLVESQSDPMPGNQYTLMTGALSSLHLTNFQTGIVSGGGHSFANWEVPLPDGALVRDHAINFLDSVLKPTVQQSAFHIDSVTPASAFNDGKTVVVIKGSGFKSDSIISVDGFADDGTSVDQGVFPIYVSTDGTIINFISPAYIKPGTYQIYVTEFNNPDQSNRVTFQLKQSTSAPTASLTVNGGKTGTFYLGDNLTYNWSSTNGTSFSSNYISQDINTGASCGAGLWFVNTASGSSSGTLPGTYVKQANCKYTLFFNVSNNAGFATSSSITVTYLGVRQSTPPTATLTANGLKVLTVNVGATVTFNWSSTNGTSYSSSYTSVNNTTGSSCGSGAWSVNTSSGTLVTTAFSPQAGCTYNYEYHVVGATSSSYSDSSAVVTVNPILYALTVTKPGAGSGTVTSNPAGITCGTTCTKTFAPYTNVVLTEVPTAGSTFAGWSNGCTGTATTCTVSMLYAKTVTATFNIATVTYPLTVTKVGGGTVTSVPAGINCGTTCSYNFNSGTLVTLSVVPITGNFFTGWSGACAGNGACSVTMSAAKSVTATFSPYTFNTLTVTKVGMDLPIIVSTPSGITCGTVCIKTYTTGSTPTSVTLNITYIPGGWYFTGWTGGCTGTNTCTVVMSSSKTVTANFKSYTGFNYDPNSINTANVLGAINDILSRQSDLGASTVSSILNYLLGNLAKVVGR